MKMNKQKELEKCKQRNGGTCPHNAPVIMTPEKIKGHTKQGINDARQKLESEIARKIAYDLQDNFMINGSDLRRDQSEWNDSLNEMVGWIIENYDELAEDKPSCNKGCAKDCQPNSKQNGTK